MPNFDVYTNGYTENYPYTGVIFGKDAPLLEAELNEMQEIINKKFKSTLSHLTSGVLHHSSAIITAGSNANNIRVRLGYSYLLSQSGEVVCYNCNTNESLANNEALLAKLVYSEADGSTSIPDTYTGSTPLTNNIIDSRLGTLSTKRKLTKVVIEKGYRNAKTGEYFLDSSYNNPITEDYIPLGYVYSYNSTYYDETKEDLHYVTVNGTTKYAFCPEYCRPKNLSSDTMENLYKHYYVYEYYDTTMPNNRRIVLSKSAVTPLEADYDIAVYSPPASSADDKAYISDIRRYLASMHVPPYVKKVSLDGFRVSGTERSDASSTTKDTVYFKPHIEADRHTAGQSATQYSKFQNDLNIIVHNAPSNTAFYKNGGSTFVDLQDLYNDYCRVGLQDGVHINPAYAGADSTGFVSFSCNRSVSFTELSVIDMVNITQLTR